MDGKEKREMAQEAIDGLRISSANVKHAYDKLIESGLRPRDARVICKAYIDPAMGEKEA